MTMVVTSEREARETIQEALGHFGYDPAYVRFDWQLPNTEAVRKYTASDSGDPSTLPSGQPRRLDALAFADSKRQDWNTSAIAVDLRQDGVVGTKASKEFGRELFNLTATPTNLVGSLTQGKVDVWFNCHDGIAGAEGVEFSLSGLKAVFRQHRSSVQRDVLADLRAGQRHLFDGQVYARRDELATFLQRGVSKATWVVKDQSWGRTEADEQANRERFSRIALALLAARILEDKGALGADRGQSADARQLLAEAQAKWDSFFDTARDRDLPNLDKWFRPEQVNVMLRCLLSHLTGPMNFALVTHEMLGDLYERALVAERSVRGDSYVDLKGVHYTPLAVTQRILERIPLESLPPTHRTVCDFACGSGSFLLAATDRLEGLFDPREDDGRLGRTAWLSQAVMGNDIDPVATLVTRLSYLVAYWNRVDDEKGVPFPKLNDKGDALTLEPNAAFGRTPNVIVGNPPFDVKGQPASAFLERALDILLAADRSFPGYIGMVMPGAFLKGKREQESVRNKLLEHAHILEVWEIPEGSIGMCADTPTCIIIAEVTGTKSPVDQHVRVCQTISRRDEAARALRDLGDTSWSYVGNLNLRPDADQQGISDALAFSPLDDIWTRLASSGAALSSIAEVVWGFTHTKAHGYPDPEFSPTAADGFVPFIRQQSALRPYTITTDDWQGSHPDGKMYWKRGTGPWTYERNWPHYESQKILISARSNRNTLSQLVAALDRNRIYPGKDFLAVTLRDIWETGFDTSIQVRPDGSDVLRWVCAILNSVIGHAWFAKHAGPRGPQAESCLTMPLPVRYNPAIARLVAELEALPRARNIDTVPTWNPQAGIVAPKPNLFDDDSGLVNSDNTFWEKAAEVNRLVIASYELSNKDTDRFTSLMRGMIDPWVDHAPRDAHLPKEATLRVIEGKTVSVDPLTQTIEVELSLKSLGNGKLVRIMVPKFMPGWALRVGAEFLCRAPVNCKLAEVQRSPWLLRKFEPISYSYLDTEVLEGMIGYKVGTKT